MNVLPHTGRTRVEVRWIDHPCLFVPRRSILESTWPLNTVQSWLSEHGGFWHIENDVMLVVMFSDPDDAMLFKLTFA